MLLSESIDYRLKLIEPQRMSEEEIDKFQSDMREVLRYMKASGNKKELNRMAAEGKFRKVDPVAAYLINEVSQSKLKIEKGKEKVDMCEAVKGIREDAREEKAKEVSIRMAAEGMAVSLIAHLVDVKEETVERWLMEATQR